MPSNGTLSAWIERQMMCTNSTSALHFECIEYVQWVSKRIFNSTQMIRLVFAYFGFHLRLLFVFYLFMICVCFVFGLSGNGISSPSLEHLYTYWQYNEAINLSWRPFSCILNGWEGYASVSLAIQMANQMAQSFSSEKTMAWNLLSLYSGCV